MILFKKKNDFIKGSILKNDCSLRKLSKYRWKTNDNYENEHDQFY